MNLIGQRVLAEFVHGAVSPPPPGSEVTTGGSRRMLSVWLGGVVLSPGGGFPRGARFPCSFLSSEVRRVSDLPDVFRVRAAIPTLLGGAVGFDVRSRSASGHRNALVSLGTAALHAREDLGATITATIGEAPGAIPSGPPTLAMQPQLQR